MFGFDEYSDLFKGLHGFRPRGRLAGRFLSASPEEQDRLLHQLYAETAAELERERAAKAAFEAKLAELGLDPARFGYLWEHEDAA